MEEHQNYWMWLGAGFTAVAVAAVGIEGNFLASHKNYPFWSAPSMIVAYIFATGALICLGLAVKGVPFPGARPARSENEEMNRLIRRDWKRIKRQRRHRRDEGQVHPVTFYTFGRWAREINTKGRPVTLAFMHPINEYVSASDSFPIEFQLSEAGWGEGPLVIKSFFDTGFEIDDTEAPPVSAVDVWVHYQQEEPNYAARVISELIKNGLILKNTFRLVDEMTLSYYAFAAESWMKECWHRLGECIPTKQALFTYYDHASAHKDELRAFLDARIKELQKILEGMS